MHKVIKIRNLHCAACAAELGEELQEIEGVEEAAVDFINQRVSLTYLSQEAFVLAVESISSFEKVEIIDENAPVRKERHVKELVSIGVSAALFAVALVIDLAFDLSPWIAFGLYLAAFAAAGWSVVWEVCKNIPKAFRGGFHGGVLLDENLLMLVAAVGAFALGQNSEGAVVMLLYQIGEYLQTLAVGSSRKAITRLMQLKSDSALLCEGEEVREVAPEELAEGDLILLRTGDKIPADCVLTEGETQLDVKSLTGESLLRDVRAGDELLAGCVNEGAAVRARVVRPYSESAVAKILDLVENSSAKKAKPEKFISRFARYYTPVVVLLAVLVAVVPPLFDSFNFSRWVASALNLLVISCPCALIISVPLTYFSGVGALARKGVLAKGATYLDVLAKVRVAAFDKTGTLTEGRFSVAETLGEPRALTIAAAAERYSSHPLAQAFSDVETDVSVHDCREIPGRGLQATADGKRVLIGNLRMMEENGVNCPPVQTLASAVYVAEEGKYVGCVLIEDMVRPEAAQALSELKKAGVAHTVMLTGDGCARAEEAVRGLPVDEVRAELLPEQKLECARELRKEGTLLYVGDGINDTPVMAESDIAVAMGALGSDAAIEASDLVLVSDSLSALPKAVKIAKKTRRIVVQNIVFSIGVKVALMIASLFGVIPLWLAVFGDVGVMLLAVLNSMRMRIGSSR